MLSSSSIDKEEREAIINAFTEELLMHVGNHDSLSNYEMMASKISLQHCDKKLSELLNKNELSQSEVEAALLLCKRINEISGAFSEKGWMLPKLNHNIPACQNALAQRMCKYERAKKTTDLKQEINSALLSAENDPSIKACDAITQLIDDLQQALSQDADNKNSEQYITDFYERVALLRKKAEKKNTLHNKIQQVDSQLYCIEQSPDSVASWQTGVELCAELVQLLQECKEQNFPGPIIRYTDPDSIQKKFLHYQNMSTADDELTQYHESIVSQKDRQAFILMCDKQIKNINICTENDWRVPELQNSDVSTLRSTVQDEYTSKNRAKKLKIFACSFIAAILFVFIIIGTVWMKNMETKSRMPFSPDYAISHEKDDILSELEAAGFTNIQCKTNEEGWCKDNEIIRITVDSTEHFTRDTYYPKEVPIVITYSSTNRIDIFSILGNWQSRSYDDISESLKKAGFTHITKNEVITPYKANDQLVNRLILNGKEYTNGHCYIPANAPIEISYYSLMINFPNNNTSFIGQNYRAVVTRLQQDGFTNVHTEEIFTGWAKGNTVLAVTVNNQTDYKESDSYAPGVKIVVKYSSNDRIRITNSVANWSKTSWRQLKKALHSQGCTNITFKEIKTTNKPDNQLVSRILIRGEPFTSGQCYVQEGTPIEVQYYGLSININKSASDIEGTPYKEAVEQLETMGFSNIVLKRKNDLHLGWFSTEGEIASITINGKDDFKDGETFRFDDEIVIVVHTYEGEGCEDITQVVS